MQTVVLGILLAYQAKSYTTPQKISDYFLGPVTKQEAM